MSEYKQENPPPNVGPERVTQVSITAERWQRIKEVFGAAWEREPGDRSAFLRQACGADESLQAEVESLLAEEERAMTGTADSQLASEVSPSAAQLSADPMIGRRIGAYQIVRKIGYGGMAAVYLAMRADDVYQRQVAIKLVMPGLDHQEILRRFRTERQTLAALDHPNIVKILDGGTTEEGLPYLIMDYVEGVPLDEYCDRHNLSTTERLQLFRAVCAAVQYAHENHVIHRDLKPSNILVSADGTPKLLDFGIAKVLNPAIGSRTLQLTQSGLRPMTPAYASPEQVRGENITPASDVYALGVVLYELLTGHPPYRLKRRTPLEIDQAICETDPEKPSTAVGRVETETGPDRATTDPITPQAVSRTRESEPEKLRRRLRGDLDNIVLMALRKEAQRRYTSVQEFSADIERHLEHRPIKAQKGTLGYRGLKFVRRHTVGVVVGAAMVLLVVGILFVLPSHVPTVMRSVPITNDALPKSGVVTDGARLYFVELTPNGWPILSQVSTKGGETQLIHLRIQLRDLYDISPAHSELLVSGDAPGLEREKQLWIVPLAGESPHRVGAILAHAACWTPNGRHIVYANEHDLYRVRDDGGEVQKLVTGIGFPDWIRFSPEGNRLRFSAENSLWEVTADGNGLHRLYTEPNGKGDECCGSWSPDGSRYYFQASDGNAQNVWVLMERRSRFRKTINKPIQITAGPLAFSEPVPSSDGKRLFVIGEQRRSELVQYDSDKKQFVSYLGGISAGQVDVSRDRQWLTYVAYPEGTLWRSKIDGTERLQLTASPVRLPRWSPDGKQIVFTGEHSKLFLVSAAGGASHELILQDKFSEIDATWSADGNSVVFGRPPGTEKTSQVIYRFDLKTQELSPLPGSEGMFSPRVSPDGRSVAAFSGDSTKLMLYDVTLSKWSIAATAGLSNFAYNNWSHDGKYIYVLHAVNEKEVMEVDRLTIPEHKLQHLFVVNLLNGADAALQWTGLGLNDSLLAMRDKSTQEIYALELQPN